MYLYKLIESIILPNKYWMLGTASECNHGMEHRDLYSGSKGRKKTEEGQTQWT